MGVISIIIGIITSLPQLISAIKQIIQLIHGLPLTERRAAVKALAEAYKAAKNGDPSKLKDLHDVLCKQLPGVEGCQNELGTD